MKSTYTKEELIHEAESCGDVYSICGLCSGSGMSAEDVNHLPDCPLLVPDVLGVWVLVLTRPDESICEECGALGKKNCPARGGDGTHESRMICGRYAVDYGRK
jgi:hypothetical protein